ncbi:cation:proton antiporter [Massilia sp. B-10]|nr:cation:proton antiporter [Massilia sp. B-10]
MLKRAGQRRHARRSKQRFAAAAARSDGGIAFGLLIGLLTYAMLRSIDSYQEEVLITLAAVIGGYALATHLHISGPLAMVVA